MVQKQDKIIRTKLTGHITSIKKLTDDITKEVISLKPLIKDLINGYSVLNGATNFADNGLQNYSMF